MTALLKVLRPALLVGVAIGAFTPSGSWADNNCVGGASMNTVDLGGGIACLSTSQDVDCCTDGQCCWNNTSNITCFDGNGNSWTAYNDSDIGCDPPLVQ